MVQQMGGERVPQHVRRQTFAVDARKDGIVFDAMPERLSGHLLATGAGEQHIQRLAVDQPRAAVFQIIFDPVDRLFAQRHQPLLVALADHPHHARRRLTSLMLSPTSSETRSPVAYNTSSIALSRSSSG